MVQICMDIYNKPTGSKRYVLFMPSHPQHCLINIPFSFARGICTIVENENVKQKLFQEMKNILLEQKYPKSLTKASILKAKEIPLDVLRQPKTAKNEELFPFVATYNANNPNVFPIIKQNFDDFQFLKQWPTFSRRRNLWPLWVKHLILESYSVGLNLNCDIKKINEIMKVKNNEMKNCGKNCVNCPYLVKASLCQVKRINKTFFDEKLLNCESSNLICVVVWKEEYIGKMGCLVKEQIGYRQDIRLPQ